jgi:hypothetical protein
MSSRMFRDIVAVGLFPAAVLVLHFVLHETWLNSFIVPLIGVGAGLVVRLATRRNNMNGKRKYPPS